MKAAIGIEIGGTKIQAGIGSSGGELLGLSRGQAAPEEGAAGILDLIPSLIESALKQADCTLDDIGGIGVGFGGPVDSKQGMTLVSHQVNGWDAFPLKKWFQERWSVPVFIQNDASVAGYAEAHLGAGKGCRRIFYITIGSGIGGGLITDGIIDEGQGLGAAEIGHTWIPDPDTGEPDKLELIASGWSIGRRARDAVEQGEASLITELCGDDISQITAKTVYTAAERDDALACALLEETCAALAVAICNVIALLDPECIVIGGGVSLMGPLFWDSLQRQVANYIFSPFKANVEIVPAALGEKVVIQGAILLGLQIGKTSVV